MFAYIRDINYVSAYIHEVLNLDFGWNLAIVAIEICHNMPCILINLILLFVYYSSLHDHICSCDNHNNNHDNDIIIYTEL